MTLQDVAWHQSIGRLIEVLDRPNFWLGLVRLLDQYIPVDSWVVLVFSNDRPRVLAECPGEDGGPDRLFEDYLKGLYLLDPFYLANREAPQSGLFLLADVAPECFEQTDYYKRYFHFNIVADEVHINVQLDAEHTLCLSLGSEVLFSPEQIALLSLIQSWVAALMRQRMAFEHQVMEQTATPTPSWQGRLESTLQHLETPLSARELEVGRLMLSGCSNKEIARKLSISTETVKVHRKHMYSKLGIRSQSELFSLFLQAQE
jgi:DNA-binding CsgD family transcriptional regulator